MVRLLPPKPGRSVEKRVAAMRHDLTERVSKGELLILVAEYEQLLVGYARASHVVRPEPRSATQIPPGWYLLGVYVAPAHRRRGLATAFTERRMAWLAERTDAAYSFTRADNEASLALHAASGFVEVARGVNAPGQPVSADRILFRVTLG